MDGIGGHQAGRPGGVCGILLVGRQCRAVRPDLGGDGGERVLSVNDLDDYARFRKAADGKKVSAVNWCPKDATVLANEQVVEGCCWRCDTPLVYKAVSSWFVAVTMFKDRMVELNREASALDQEQTAGRFTLSRYIL